MTTSHYYVDPSIAANSGAGTIGDPYGDLQYALDTITRDATDGDQINIKAGTDEVLAAALDLSSYGTPTEDAPVIISGYENAAGDGGIGVIDCNSNSLFSSTTLDHIVLKDLEIHSGGSANIVHLDTNITIINCTIHGTTGNCIVITGSGYVFNCYFYDANIGTRVAADCIVLGNYFENKVNDFAAAISAVNNAVIINNIIDIDGSTDGISVTGNKVAIINNTLYSNSGSGQGIDCDHSIINVLNNYFEGFSAAGGRGVLYRSNSRITMHVNNYFYNNNQNEIKNGEVWLDTGNVGLSESGLVDPANGDFRAKGNLRAGAWPGAFPEINLPQYLDIGAVQRKEPLRLPKIHRL